MAAGSALVWANSPWSGGYAALRDASVGPSALGLHLTLGAWAADGLLAVFFLVAGLELAREFVAGELRDPRRGLVPVAAAVGGVVVPALVYLLAAGSDAPGWAVPTATDIAFALAVLAVAGPGLPPALRTFLLTLAVVDDLLAITIIAVAYTGDLELVPLGLALVALGLFATAARSRARAWLLPPLAVLTWALVHASGVHATVAGVLLGLAVPVRGAGAPGPAARLEHRLRPVSTGVALPVFALLAAGVDLGGTAGLRDSLSDPVAVGVVLGLVLGKPVGVLLAVGLLTRCTPAALDPQLRRGDVVALALLTGVGFTVSLLIAELALADQREAHAKAAVLVASALVAVVAGVVLRLRARALRARGAVPPGAD